MARRRYQEGTIFLRGKNPVWVGRYTVDQVIGGVVQRIRKSVMLGTKKELPTLRLARRVLDTYLSPINSTEYKAQSTTTFEEFAEKWQTQILPQSKPSTIADALSILRRHLVPYFSDLPLSEIRTEAVQAFITIKAAECGPARVRKMTVTLTGMLKTAKRWGYIEHTVNGLVFPRMNAEARRWFTVAELSAIIAKAPEPDATLYHLLAETGLRAGEAFGLKPEDLTGNMLTVRRSAWNGFVTEPKTRAGGRTICLSQGLSTRLHTAGNLEWIFPDRDGSVLTAGTQRRRLVALLTSLTLPPGGFHAFRHANATMLDSVGAPMALRQQRLGHASIQTTLGVYTHQVSSDALDLASKFEGMFETQLDPTTSTKL
jgi:integrase